MCEDTKLADIDFNDIGNVVKARVDKKPGPLAPFLRKK